MPPRAVPTKKPRKGPMKKFKRNAGRLIRDLSREHASNAVIKRQVRRGLALAKGMIPRAPGFAGSGDYRMIGNSLIAGNVSGSGGDTKSFINSITSKRGKGSITIRNSEYIGELISPTANNSFAVQSYGINAQNSVTFPWLSSLASAFQMHRFTKLVFEYRPLVSEATSTTAATLLSMGTVIFACQYDSVEGAFLNKIEMENSEAAISVKPSQGCFFGVECNPQFNPLGMFYNSPQVVTTSVPNADIRMQNLGIFQAGSSGVPTASNTAVDLGEIWVHYECELHKTVLGGYHSLLSAHYAGSSTTSGTVSTTNPFGVNAATQPPTQKTGSLLNMTFTANSFIFPVGISDGSWLCCYYVHGTSATVAFTAPTVSNGTLLTIWRADQDNYEGMPGSGSATVQLAFMLVVSVNAPGSSLCSVTLNTTVLPATVDNYDLVITPYNIAGTN